MFENQRFMYHLLPLLVIIIAQGLHGVHGLITKLDVGTKKDGYYLNEKVPINFYTNNQLKIACIENTSVNFIGQNNKNSDILKLKCENDYRGSITLPGKIEDFGENIDMFKLAWKYTNKASSEVIDIETNTFKVNKKKIPNNNANGNKLLSNNNNNNNDDNDNDNNNNNNNNNKSNDNVKDDNNDDKSEIKEPLKDNTDINANEVNIVVEPQSKNDTIESKPKENTSNTVNKSTSTNVDADNKKESSDTKGLSALNKIMFAIIICLIGGIMVVTVKLIKTKNENNERGIGSGRMKDSPNINEIKFPPLRMNPLDSESFLSLNNSTTFDLIESSKMTSIYIPYEESIIPGAGHESLVTFPINKINEEDNENRKSIFSSP